METALRDPVVGTDVPSFEDVRNQGERVGCRVLHWLKEQKFIRDFQPSRQYGELDRRRVDNTITLWEGMTLGLQFKEVHSHTNVVRVIRQHLKNRYGQNVRFVILVPIDLGPEECERRLKRDLLPFIAVVLRRTLSRYKQFINQHLARYREEDSLARHIREEH